MWGATPVFLTGAAGASQYTAGGTSSDNKAGVVYLGPASDELRGLSSNVGVPADDVWRRANNMFEGITRKGSTEFGGLSLRGWADPDLSENNRKGSVESIQDAFAKTVAEMEPKKRAPGSVPSPCDEECRQSLRDALATGSALQSAGKVQFDGEGAPPMLTSPGVIGAFVYTKAKAIGVFYSEKLALVAKYAGDSIAGATAAHELGHADDHGKGKLDPKQVKDGEKRAFRRQYGYLLTLDPKGEVMAKLRYNLVGKPWVPQVVSDYLEHLAMVRLYGDKGDFDGLVDKLGYEDPDHDPFHGHDHDGGPQKGPPLR